MTDMARKEIMPAVSMYTSKLSEACIGKQKLGLDYTYELSTLKRISPLQAQMYRCTEALDKAVLDSHGISDKAVLSQYCRDEIIPKMNDLRISADELETLTSSEFWPFPNYGELLFGVK